MANDDGTGKACGYGIMKGDINMKITKEQIKERLDAIMVIAAGVVLGLIVFTGFISVMWNVVR